MSGATGGRARLPLVVWTTLLVLAAALLPMAISVFQLRSNGDALRDQVQRTHMVATSSLAARLDSHLARLRSQASALASHPLLRNAPQSEQAQTLLRATLQAEDALSAIAAYTRDGALLVRAQRRDLPASLDRALAAAPPSDWQQSAISLSADGGWLRLDLPLEGQARLVCVAEAAPLEQMTTGSRLGESARLALLDDHGRVLAGDPRLPAALSEPTRNAAISGRLAAGAGIDRRAGQLDSVYAYAPLDNAPWQVLSIQPAKAAELARAGIRRATLVGVAGAILLALAFAATIYGALVRPLQRVIRAQWRLAGTPGVATGGSEVDQLETSLAHLAERLRDRQELDEIFLGRYQVLDLAGTGSSSSVFRGWDPKLERPVALKTVRLDQPLTALQPGAGAEAASGRRHRQTDRLLGEAVTHARFVHPNIVTLYDLVDTGRAAFIAMELVDGCSLEAYLKRYAPLAPDQVIALGLAVARGLDTAHRDGLVHQDVKPGNILLGTDGSIKVADFGIAQLTPLAARADESISGTPGYLAPESLEGHGCGPKSDLFALGVVLYEAVVGKHPFRGRKRTETLLRTLEARPERVDVLRPETPEALVSLIHSLLARNPERRAASAELVIETLERLAGANGVVWQPQPLPQPPPNTGPLSTGPRAAGSAATTKTWRTAPDLGATRPAPPATKL